MCFKIRRSVLSSSLFRWCIISIVKMITWYNSGKKGVKCMVYNNYYFKNEFDCQPYVCNKYHEFSIIVMNLNYFFVLNIKNVEYRVYISGIDKKKLWIF